MNKAICIVVFLFLVCTQVQCDEYADTPEGIRQDLKARVDKRLRPMESRESLVGIYGKLDSEHRLQQTQLAVLLDIRDLLVEIRDTQ